jgi:hypothetical protein
MSKPYRPPVASIALFMAGRAHRLGLSDPSESAPTGAAGRADDTRWLRDDQPGRRATAN